MQRKSFLLVAVALVALLPCLVLAQQYGGRGQGRGQGQGLGQGRGPQMRGQQMQGPPFQMMMRMLPLMQALDTDKNGELSSEEIENATASLKMLDKNNDDKLDQQELMPQMPHGGRFPGNGQGPPAQGRGQNARGR